MQGKNRDTDVENKRMDTDVENKRMDTKGGDVGEWDELGDWNLHIYTTIYKIDT